MSIPRLDGFEEFTEIGRGGFGVVYRARQPALNRYVAIKFLAATLNSSGRERLSREALAMGALSGHPNIVSVVDVGIPAEGEPYLVMPYLARGSLADAIATQGSLPWTDVARIGVKLAGALESAHRLGILHRDVKPGNILISDFGEPQLADFGLARVSGAFETTSRHITASVSHAAPEILEGKKPSAAADVYSLASTLYALVAGKPAFTAGDEESLVALYVRIASSPVPDLGDLDVPASLFAALASAMSKQPQERPVTAEAFGRELQQVEAAMGVPVTELPIKEPSPALAPVSRASRSIASGPTRVAAPARSGGRAWPKIAVGVGAVIAVVGATIVLSTRGDPSTAEAADVSCLAFPEDVSWYQPIDGFPVDVNSSDYIASIENTPEFTSGTLHAGFDAEGGGATYNVVTDTVDDTVPVVFTDESAQAESDPGPYLIPADPNTQDGYVVVVDDTTCTSYELWGDDELSEPWTHAEQAGIFDLNAFEDRPDGQRSAIQSGLPMFPLLVRYDEVATGSVDHALLFNSPTQSGNFMHPATRGVEDGDSEDMSLPPLGSRFRLQPDFACGELVTPEARTVCVALQTYGMYLGGSSGSLFDLQGAGDSRWGDDFLDDIEQIVPSDFEVVDSGEEIR